MPLQLLLLWLNTRQRAASRLRQILGTWWARLLNVISGLLSAGAAPAAATSYESIATVTVGAGGSSTITFSSIPSTYKHLQIRGIGKTTRTGGPYYNDLYARFNGDTASNYAWHLLQGNGTAASAQGAASATYAMITPNGVPSASRSGWGAYVIDILDYTNTSKYKTVRTLGGDDDNGSGYINLTSGLWQSTSAISSIVFYPEVGFGDFAQYSSFALYGIKG